MPLKNRRLRDHRKLRDSGAGRAQRLDRLAVPAPFRQRRVFCALLGDPDHGRWLIAPTQDDVQIARRYVGDTLVLETVFTTANGTACLTDFMYRRNGSSELVRIVKGLHGEVSMRTEIIVRFDYGAIVPWVSQQDDGRLQFIAGPDKVLLDTNIETRGEAFAPSEISPSAKGRRRPSSSTGRRRSARLPLPSRARSSMKRANRSNRSGPAGPPLSSRRTAGATPFFARSSP